MASPFAVAPGGVGVLVRVSPRSGARRVLGLADRPDGRADLKIALTSAPEGGRANAELIGFLAAEWRVPKRALTLLTGAADRRKTLRLAGEPAHLLPRLETWLAGCLAKGSRR